MPMHLGQVTSPVTQSNVGTENVAPVRALDDVVFTIYHDGEDIPITVRDFQEGRTATSLEALNPKVTFWKILARDVLPVATRVARALVFCLLHPDAPDARQKALRFFTDLMTYAHGTDQGQFVYREMNAETVTICLAGVDAAPLTLEVLLTETAKRATENLRDIPDPTYDELAQLLVAGGCTEGTDFALASNPQKTALGKLALQSTYTALAEALAPKKNVSLLLARLGEGVQKTPKKLEKYHELEESKEAEDSKKPKPSAGGAELADLRELKFFRQVGNDYARAYAEFRGPKGAIGAWFVITDKLHCVRVEHQSAL